MPDGQDNLASAKIGRARALKLPIGDLAPDASEDERTDAVNALLHRARAWDRASGVGGVGVLIAEGNVVISAGAGDATGGKSTAGNGGAPANPADDGDPVNDGEDGTPDDADGPVDYDDLATAYTPPPGSTILYSYRQRSVTATLVGFDEFVPSIPARKYLTRTSAGSVSYFIDGVGTQGPNDMAGAQVFDPVTSGVTGVLPDAYWACLYLGNCYGVYSPNWLSPDAPCSSLLFNLVETSTLRTWTSSGNGITVCGPGPAYVIGGATLTLTNEDTEWDAIARATGTWGSWAPLVLPGEVAESTARTTGFTLTSTEAEVEVSVTGFDADSTFTARAYLSRRNLATGIEEAWETHDYPMPTNGGGAGDVTFSVRAESGYAVSVQIIGFLL